MLEIRIWDVQHGNAVYIKTPNGKHIVQDLGIGCLKERLSTFSPLWYLKYRQSIARLDQVIITHPHKDHIDDIGYLDILSPKLLVTPAHLTDKEIRDANKSEDAGIINKYLEIKKTYNQSVPVSENSSLPENNGGVLIETFMPEACPRTNINNHSIVTVITYSSKKIIIPGDNEPDSWKELLSINKFIQAIKNADILVASHHGKDSGYCSELFEHFTPKLVVVSDGRFCDTSAADRYSAVASGWKVHSRSSKDQIRKCLSTRTDGVIVISIAMDNTSSPVLSVTID